jgi:hypothetical protein
VDVDKKHNLILMKCDITSKKLYRWKNIDKCSAGTRKWVDGWKGMREYPEKVDGGSEKMELIMIM